MSRHTPAEERPHPVMPGIQRRYEFPNGYGASVVRFKMLSFMGREPGYGSYTDNENEWEVAVLGPDGHIAYDTPIGGDVVGHVKDGEELDDLLDRIAALPEKEATR